MKIAVVFSAQVRTALHAVPNIKKFIGDLWPQCDFFCHTWLKDTDKLHGYGISLLENKITVSQSIVDDLCAIYNFKKFKMENWEDVALVKPYDPPLFYSWIESIKFKKEYEEEHNFKYDYVVKLRLDNIYSDRITLRDLINKTELNSLAVNNIMDNGSIDDFLFVSDSITSDKMITIYNDWLNSTKTYFAHLEIPDFLKRENIKLISLGIDTNAPAGTGSDIIILRSICLNYDTLTEFNKCFECDKILYWAGVDEPHQVCQLTKDELLDLARRVKAKYNILPNVLKHFKDEI